MSSSASSPPEKSAESSAPPTSFVSAIKTARGPLIGSVLTFPAPLCAKLAARSGLQWVMIDMEHATYSAETATNIVHAVIAASQGRCLPIIRVPSHGVEWIKWALDSGAAGIIIPMVNSGAEMKEIIDRAVYPPGGSRSFGPFNAPFSHLDPAAGFPEYYQRAKSGAIAILPIIESRQGVQNAEAILSVPGVTGVFIGPYDLRLSLGVPGGIDGPEPVFVDALEKVIATAKKLGKVVGSMGVGEEIARKRTEQGMDFLLSSLDYNALVRGYKSDLEDARRGITSASKL